MLTPRFTCSQDDTFMVVDIVLSNHCKLGEAQFDILEKRFTFHCRPYYLRLSFDVELTEAAGERAQYNVETNALRVWVPKLLKGEMSQQLDNPAYLLATELQRRRMVEVVGSSARAGSDDDDEGEEEETEYVQQQPHDTRGSAADLYDAVRSAGVKYGFNSEFCGCFTVRGAAGDEGDEALRGDAVDLLRPETTLREERRVQRELDELKHFDEDCAAYCTADEEGEVAEVLAFRPWYIAAFEEALHNEGVQFVAPRAVVPVTVKAPVAAAVPRTPGDIGRVPPPAAAAAVADDGGEEDEAVPDVATGAEGQPTVLSAWEGNVGEFNSVAAAAAPSSPEAWSSSDAVATSSRRLVEEIAPTTSGENVEPVTRRNQLACPRVKPQVELTPDEVDTLSRVPRRKMSLTGVINRVQARCLLTDLVLAYVYDHICTSGDGCAESLWTVWKLCSSLCWLDEYDDEEDVVIAFARRVLTFPLHRTFDLVARCVRDVGVLFVSGRTAVLKGLARVKNLIDHSEGKHVLSTIIINPLIAYLQSEPLADINAWLEQGAIRLHDVMAPGARRIAPVPVATSAALRVVASRGDRPEALSVLHLGLPLSE